MKKIFALLFAALSVAFFACGDEKTDNGNDWFLTPAASADGTTVELTCLTRFGDGVLEELGAGFACAELTGGSLGEFVDYKDVTVDGSRLSARVSGLRPRTTYIFYAFAELPTGRIRSASAAFDTGEESDPDPDPDPDPVEGETLFTNQLPVAVGDGGGYRNALGLIFSSKVDGTVTKARLYTCAQESGVHNVSLWERSTGQMVSAEVYEWEINPGTEGWQEFTLPEPVNITANKEYVISISTGPDCLYVYSEDTVPIENGNLMAAAGSGRYTPLIQGMPNEAYQQQYFRDVVFVPAN